MNPDRLYDLAAVVVHCGTGINRGHYIAIVKSHRFWLLFDDDAVDVSTQYLFLCVYLHMKIPWELQCVFLLFLWKWLTLNKP